MRTPALLLLLFGLASCAQSQSATKVEPLLREPLPVLEYQGPSSLSQVVTNTYGPEKHSLRVETEFAPGRMVMVGVSHLGAPLFELVLENGTLQSRTLGATTLPFDPRFILSDVQLAYWPFDKVRAALRKGGYELRQSDDRTERLIYDPYEKLIVRILFTQQGDGGADLRIQHFDLPYELQIETLEQGGIT